ncbi:MAG: tetratricopeptide repeat protein, partial [Deltaproteobacteria bacterium]|nr:tetratricopeptide repeat protein [Deltaproteobacteria bacterium]
EALLRLGDTAAAVAELDQSVGVQSSALGHYLRGIARLILGDNKGADADFERCTKVHMEEDFWWQRDYEKGRSYNNARYYHHLIKTSPGKRFSAAEVWRVDRWLRDPTPADRVALSGAGCLYWGAYDAAEERYKAALALEPDNGIAWAGLVDTHRYRGDLARALATGEEALAKGVRHTFLYNNLGYAIYKKRDYKRAETLYRYALDILPQNSQARVNLARLLERTGRSEEATGHWNITNAAPEFVWNPLGPYKYPALALVYALDVLLVIQRQRRTGGAGQRK